MSHKRHEIEVFFKFCKEQKMAKSNLCMTVKKNYYNE